MKPLSKSQKKRMRAQAGTVLDLHGVRHGDVKDRVIQFIEANWGTKNDLEIITGHSHEMKKIVEEVLSEYELAYRVGGYLGVDDAMFLITGGQT